MLFNRIDVKLKTPVLDLLSITSRVPLLKRKIKVQFFGETHEVNCKAMFDSGAVCSFLQQTVLKIETSNLVNRFLNHVEGDTNPLKLIEELITIKGAVGATTERCAVVSLGLKIGECRGVHEFIITKSLVDKEIILGRDFMRSNHVVIDHGKDRITIRQQVKFNNVGSKRVQPLEVNSILLNDTVVKPKCEHVD